jgi:hypothetical protein
MDADKEWLVNENLRLQRVLRRWRAVAIAALIMVFGVLIPFTIFFHELAIFRQVESLPKIETVLENAELRKKNEELEKQLEERANRAEKQQPR